MRRQPSQEWLDDDRGTPAEIAASLDDLWRINRWLGGVSGTLLLFERFFARAGPHAVRVLDIGAGDARLAAFLERKMKDRKMEVQFTVLDRRIAHLSHASAPGMSRWAVAADTFALPFAEATFDVVMCNLFLHHFSDGAAIRLLKALMAIAREAVLINDLERSAIAYFFIRTAWPLARGRITKHDGPASVRQAYTLQELRALVEEAGCHDYELESLWPYRLGLILWK